MVFVFGSNRAGIHKSGAAKHALYKLGAVYGIGEGPTGQCYALPTKDERIQSLTLEQIKTHVDTFIEYARDHPELSFQVTQVGCGLAGYTREQIAPFFLEAPSNCLFDRAWEQSLGNDRRYWGRF